MDVTGSNQGMEKNVCSRPQTGMEPLIPGAGHPIVAARSLTRVYAMAHTQVVGLNGIDLDIMPGEMVVLKGDSGSGKSTLLALLAGLDRPTGGRLRVAGFDMTDLAPDRCDHFRRKVVGMVFQNFNLLPTLNVLENVCLPGLLAGDSLDRVRGRALRWLDWLGMARRVDHLPDQLSGGEMQRAAIARALINDPALILADEPTGNLDSRNGDAVIRLLSELNARHGRTVIVATHSIQADPYAHRRICLRDGVIRENACEP